MKSAFLLSCLAIGAFAATATPPVAAPAADNFAVVSPTLSSDTRITSVLAVKWNKQLTTSSFNALRDAVITAAMLTDDEKSKLTVELPEEKMIFFLIHEGGSDMEGKLRTSTSQEYTINGEKYSSSSTDSASIEPPSTTEMAYIYVIEYPQDAPTEALEALEGEVGRAQLSSGKSIAELQAFGREAVMGSTSKGKSLGILNGDKVSDLVDAANFFIGASVTVNEKTYKYTVTKKNVAGGYKVTFPSFAYGVDEDIRKTVDDKGGFSDLETLDIAVVAWNREVTVWIAEGAKQDAMTAAVKAALEGDVKGFADIKMKAAAAPQVLAAPAVNDDSGSGSLLIIIIIVVVIIILAAVAAAVAFFLMKKREQKTIQVAPAAETA